MTRAATGNTLLVLILVLSAAKKFIIRTFPATVDHGGMDWPLPEGRLQSVRSLPVDETAQINEVWCWDDDTVGQNFFYECVIRSTDPPDRSGAWPLSAFYLAFY